MPMRKRKPAATHPREIDEDTAICPEIIAYAVLREVAQFENRNLPKKYASWLARQTRLLYRQNAACRKQIRRPGNAGRDWVYAFCRLWLAARLYRERYQSLLKLPKVF